MISSLKQKRQLTKKEGRFVALRATGLSGARAARLAYPEANYNTAKTLAHRILKKPEAHKELTLLKTAFRQAHMEEASKVWTEALKKRPKKDINWRELLDTAYRTFEISGLKEKPQEEELSPQAKYWIDKMVVIKKEDKKQ